MFWRKPFSGKFASAYQYQGANFSECGPASLAMILRQHRHNNSVTTAVCRAQQRTPSWWTANNIQVAAKRLGLNLPLANYTVSRKAGIYLSTYWGFGHWVVAWKASDGRIQVLCPKRGAYITTDSAFRRKLKSTVYVATEVVF